MDFKGPIKLLTIFFLIEGSDGEMDIWSDLEIMRQEK